ncbi:NTPase KAP [Leptospira yasudae]|nr:NTPase KAP [Leptospira yasudae]
MFSNDKPIQSKNEDLLGRMKYAKHLSNAIISWIEKESLVVAINGKWGSGKSSLINLVKNEILESKIKNGPTILEFNPWEFTQQERLADHFFNEIAKELKHKGNGKEDEKIALKLKRLAKIIELTPEPKSFFNIFLYFTFLLNTSGLASFAIFKDSYISWFLIGFGILNWLILFSLKGIRKILINISNFFEIESKLNDKSNATLKSEISLLLSRRESKLLIIVDNLDRLAGDEIKKMFAVIRANADFPNVIFLLAFDRNVIEKSLEGENEISGREFLEKIVQVSFEIPYIGTLTLRKILLTEIESFISNYPNIKSRFFSENDNDWANVYYSGFEELFTSLRSVRRYLNSFRFNFTHLLNEGLLEVNPIDLIALEAIRIFEPDYYDFIKAHDYIFISLGQYKYNLSSKDERKENFEQSLLVIKNEKNRSSIEKIVRRLFPQIDGLYTNTSYSNNKSSWFSNLHICSPERFGRYFTLLPGKEEDEITELQIQTVLRNFSDLEMLEKVFNDLLEEGKFRVLLDQLQYYTYDERYIKITDLKNLSIALFNALEKLEKIEDDLYTFGPDSAVYHIVVQIMSRSDDKEKNYLILRDAILNSNGLSAEIYTINTLSRKDEMERFNEPIETKNLILLKELCVQKIKDDLNSLMQCRLFIDILYRWRDWGNPVDVQEYCKEIISNSESLIAFLCHFTGVTRIFGNHVQTRIPVFQLKLLKDFVEIEEIESKVNAIMLKGVTLDEKGSEAIRLFRLTKNKFDSESRV